LVVQVLNGNGQPEQGVEVRFDASSSASRMQVGAVASAGFTAVVGATTDANGRATVRVRYGTSTGDGFVVSQVPLYNLIDTARYTVLPGLGTGVLLAPRDTMIALGTSFSYRGGVVDRLGNPRTDPTTYEPTPQVLITSAGRATSIAYGAGYVKVRATVGGTTKVDSGRIVVVPNAELLAHAGNNMVLTDLAGSNRRIIATADIYATMWLPGGDRVVGETGGELRIMDLQGTITNFATTGVVSVKWPEYSTDGQWIYFHAIPGGDVTYYIHRIRPDGSGLSRLSTQPGRYPTPSPDGTRFAYVHLNTQQLLIHDLATGVTTPLAGAVPASTPRWSPDGNWIAYLTQGDGALMLVHPNGSGLHRIGAHGLFPGISWSGDSRWIIGYENRATLTDANTGVMMDLPWFADVLAWRR
jgi:hypothetical protein